MIQVQDIYNFIDDFAPFSSAMDFDNCGLLVGDMNAYIKNILVSLDITNEVINEANTLKANLIISHHPIIFNKLKNISSGSPVYNLIKSDISAICAHTNLDMAEDAGVNTCLAKALNVKNIKTLSTYKNECYNKIVVFVPKDNAKDIIESMSNAGAGILGNYSECSFISLGEGTFRPNENSNPYIGALGKYEKVKECKIEMICSKSKTKNAIDAMLKVHPYEMPAYDIFDNSAIKSENVLGLIGEIDNKLSASEFAYHVKSKLDCNGLRYFNYNDSIKKVALCSGAGGDLISKAINQGADAFVTGEIKHHEILLAKEHNITVVDAGHFKTEDIVIQPLIDKLKENFKCINFIKSKTFKDDSLYI